MNERERLIELLMQGELEADKQGIFNCSQSKRKAEIIADFLIGNGVILPPVKIGEVVYEIYDDEIIEARINRIDIYEDVVDIYTQTEIFDDDEWFSLTDIGKTVFLTREEAENKLEEIKKRNE